MALFQSSIKVVAAWTECPKSVGFLVFKLIMKMEQAGGLLQYESG